MTQSSEVFIINKCSSMSFKELSEYIATCFEYLENPQNHLADAKKAPVLKENYDLLIERLESKLNRFDNLVYCKNEFETFEIAKIVSKTLDNFDTLKHYYLEIVSDKNKILQNKQKIEKLSLLILKYFFSGINIASIYINSSEPFNKILTLLNALPQSSNEIKQVISRYKFIDFQNLFSETLSFNPFKLIAFSYSFWNSVKLIIEADFRLNARSIIDLKQQTKLNEADNHLAEFVKNLKEEWKYFGESEKPYKTGKQHTGFQVLITNIISRGATQWNDLEKLIDYEKTSQNQLDNVLNLEKNSSNWLTDSKYRQREIVKRGRLTGTKVFRDAEASERKYSNQFINLFETLKEKGLTQISRNSLSKLDNKLIERICEESDWEMRLKGLLNLESVWSKFIKEIRKNSRENSKARDELINETQTERTKFCDHFTESLNTFLKNIVNQINFDLDKALQSEGIDLGLEYSKEVIYKIKKSRDRIFADSRQRMIVKEIFWDLLPQGEWRTEGLIKTFKGYGWSKDEFDESRLTQIIKSLNPSICYIGKEKFQGYVVFGFDSTEKVVLECPKYGNAIYIIKGNWQEITKLSKWEARKLSQVTVIRHSDSWFERLKQNLGRRY